MEQGEVRASRYLSTVQRVVAAFAAAAFGALGFVAIFVSGSEVGAAAALVICGILTLVAVQGTPVVRLSTGTASADLTATHRRTTAEQAMVAAVDDPEEAEVQLRELEKLDPGARQDPIIARARNTIYSQREMADAVAGKITNLLPGAEPVTVDGGLGYQLGESLVVVRSTYRQDNRRIWLGDVRKAREAAADARAAGAVIVSNVDPTLEAKLAERATPPVTFVRWLQDGNSAPIRTAIEALAQRRDPDRDTTG